MGCQPKVDIEAERGEAKAVLDAYVASVEAEDMELYARNIAHNPAMVNFDGFGNPCTWVLEKREPLDNYSFP